MSPFVRTAGLPEPLRRGLPAGLILLAALPPAAAEAVIPSAFGPLQALLVILPQLLVALGAALLGVFRPRTYRMLFLYLWTHKAFSLGLAAAVVLVLWAPGSIFGTRAAAEKGGIAWASFRGGPERCGAVPGSPGPAGRPRVAWKLAGEALGSSAVVDSSPAVVGNRLYAGVGNLSPFGASGAIVAVDADTGALAWKYTGKGDLDPPLKPVFSSPAVWTEGNPPAARFLVSGEGYHEDRDCRILCLDLEPARSGQPPRLLWSVQTTSHVESAPCIHEGRVFIGAGDDGLWGVDLGTGKVLWHLEGAPFYEVVGPQAEALARLEGRTVVAFGTARRVVAGEADEVGTLTLEVRSFAEGTVIAPFDGRTFERPVRGRVERKGGKVRIVPETHYPDCESPPAAVGSGSEARVLFGCGVGGNAVVCVKAATGERVWRSSTPHPAFGAPAVSGGRVLVGVGNGNYVRSDPNPAGALLAFALEDGRELWRIPADDTIIGAVAVREGRAYACCRDGSLYAANVADGGAPAKLAVGSPMVCSPAATEGTLVAATTDGKVFGLDRRSGRVLWSVVLTPEKEIFSSPVVSGRRLYVGTRGRGIVALEQKPETGVAKAVKPWLGPGGDAGRTGCADDRGLPPVEGDTADLKWPGSDLGRLPIVGPLAAEGRCVYAGVARDGAGKAFLGIDATTGRRLRAEEVVKDCEVSPRGDGRPVHVWLNPDGTPRYVYKDRILAGLESLPVRPPALAYNLRFQDGPGTGGSGGELRCLSDVSSEILWSVPLETRPLEGPSVSGDRVFLPCAGKGDARGFLEARKVADGSLLWRQPLDEPPTSYVVAAGDWVAVAVGDRIAVFRAADGRAREPIPVGGAAVAPALCGDVLVIAGEERIAAYDLSASEWLWNYRDQDHIGTATGPPVVAGEVIWVGTTKKGLVAIGVPPVKGP